MALTQTQLIAKLAEETELTKAEVKTVLTALEETILSEINEAEKVKIGSLVQLQVKLKPATKEREGRNPATGETITIAAKPASVQLKARPLAKAKNALPTVQKAKKVLG
ncbi:MAG: HU family DNA-binding protein [Thermoleophilia bacterium]|nr:HU family DNA-binding protein [Thermoleophilia bacterium]